MEHEEKTDEGKLKILQRMYMSSPKEVYFYKSRPYTTN
jgi:hypothetical protein